MVTNEKLVELFRETKDLKNRDIIFKELHNRLYKGVIKIYSFYVKILHPKDKAEFIEDSGQEAMICLLDCINKFQSNRDVKFITFYYSCLQNHLCQFYRDKFKCSINEICNTDQLEGLSDEFQCPDNFIDNTILNKIFNNELSKIDFQKELHEKIFRDWVGFNEDNQEDTNFASLGRKYNLTRMAVKKICNKYFKLYKEQLEKDKVLDKVKEFL